MSTRRELLQASALAGGGLALGFVFGGCATHGKRGVVEEGVAKPNAWLRIHPEGRLVLVVDRVEMGQGTMTSAAQLLAEELGVEPAALDVEFAPADPAYGNRIMQAQITGDSTSTRSSWKVLRRAGATAREMLRRAAAQAWGVPLDEVEANAGACVAGARRAPYGALAARAARMRPPPVKLKESSAFEVIGRDEPRLDARAKVDGTALYGIDVRLPQMMTAVVVRPPVFGAKLRSFEPASALAVRGVEHVVEIDAGVGVVARGFWAAKKGAEALRVEWSGGQEKLDDAQITGEHRALIEEEPAFTPIRRGKPAAALEGAASKLEAVYEVPYLAHAAMEPMNATVFVQAHRCDVWAGVQAPDVTQSLVAATCGLPSGSVRVHTTYLGGGFGRRSGADYVVEATQLSKALGIPVRVVWTREDDLRHGQFRQRVTAKLEAAHEGGVLKAWRSTLVSPSIIGSILTDVRALPWVDPRVGHHLTGAAAETFLEGKVPDPTSIEGMHDLPYEVPHEELRYQPHETGVPVTFWRSVGNSFNAFFIESFLDELAHASGRDPVELRLALLPADTPHRAVLKAAADAAGWGEPAPPGVHRGVARHAAYGSYCAQVVELSVDAGRVNVRRVVAAVDVGQVVNPDLVRAQVEGGVVWGLSSALKHAISIQGGRVTNSNFHDFPVLRLHETPDIEVHILERLGAPPGGVGELAVPPVAPAVANAIFAATGQRLRRLPLKPEAT